MMKKIPIITSIILSNALLLFVILCNDSRKTEFNGLDMNLGTLSKLSNAQTRSISAENMTGEKGGGAKAVPSSPKVRNVSNASHPAKELGKGWKVNPYLHIAPNEVVTIADIKGSGAIQHIWMTPSGNWRNLIIRMYWDGEKDPSVEAPMGDFFCMGHNKYAQVSSLPVCVNPGQAFNCYWKMPFRKSAKITVENRGPKERNLYFQLDYVLTEIDENEAYFHAQYRQSYPTDGAIHTILDGVKGKGQYVGAYFAWRVNNTGWWGEGEVKFYIDGDTEYPTICGTGFEDYICGSYNFDVNKKYKPFTTPYTGMPQVIAPNGTYKPASFGLYRWHIVDPIRFNSDLRITVQDLGWKKGWIYLQQKSDISSVAFWYQTEPHAKFPPLPSKDDLFKQSKATTQDTTKGIGSTPNLSE